MPTVLTTPTVTVLALCLPDIPLTPSPIPFPYPLGLFCQSERSFPDDDIPYPPSEKTRPYSLFPCSQFLCSAAPPFPVHHGGLRQALPGGEHPLLAPPPEGSAPMPASTVKWPPPSPPAPALTSSCQRRSRRRRRRRGLHLPLTPAVAVVPALPPRARTGQGKPTAACSGGGALAADCGCGEGAGRPGGAGESIARSGSRLGTENNGWLLRGLEGWRSPCAEGSYLRFVCRAMFFCFLSSFLSWDATSMHFNALVRTGPATGVNSRKERRQQERRIQRMF